jgi:tetratricopeptide (TPR) repeat protein
LENSSRLTRALTALAAIAWLCAATTVPVEGARFSGGGRRLLEDAHNAASEDRHGAAIACALAAIRLDPDLEGESALLIANQLTWSDRPREAIPWYETHLRHHPGDCDGSLGLARALSWVGRLDEAAGVYASLGEDCVGADGALGVARMEAWKGAPPAAARRYGDVLEADPGSREAALGLANAENQRGRHRRAAEIYRRLLEEDPSDGKARVGLARAQYWMGRHDLALATLEGVDDSDAEELQAVVRREEHLRVEAEGSAFTDVDDQELESVLALATVGWHPQSGGRLEVVHATTREPGSDGVRAFRGTVGAWWRPSQAWAVNAYVGAIFPRADVPVPAGEGETRTPEEIEEVQALWDTWATWTPADWTRFDLAWARVPIETPKALARGILIDVLALSGERRITDEFVLRAHGSLADYSDGNSRTVVSGSAEYGPLLRGKPVTFRLGGGGSYLAFDEDRDHGYYSPENYDTIWASVRAVARLGHGVTLDLTSRLASERENGVDRFGVWANSGELRWQSRTAFAVAIFGQQSTSRFDTSAGYAREGWGILVSLAP